MALTSELVSLKSGLPLADGGAVVCVWLLPPGLPAEVDEACVLAKLTDLLPRASDGRLFDSGPEKKFWLNVSVTEVISFLPLTFPPFFALPLPFPSSAGSGT